MVGGNLRLGWEIVFQGHMDMGNTVVDNGMSIVAIDMATDKICGTFTAMDNQSWLDPSFGIVMK